MKNIFLFIMLFSISALAVEPARIASKIFTEGYLLSEILAQKLESAGYKVERKLGLGATGVTEEAMKGKKIDLIVDYSGSITRAYFKSTENLTVPELRTRLEKVGYTISDSLGFNNTYTFAVRSEWAKANSVSKFSDLKIFPQVRAAVSYTHLTLPTNREV